MTQNRNLPSVQDNTPSRAMTNKDKAVAIYFDRQKLEELKIVTLERAQKNMDMSLRIIRKWLEVPT